MSLSQKPKAKKGNGPVYLNVVSATIRANRKKLKLDPETPLARPITARTTRRGPPAYAHQVDILDAAGTPVASLVYNPHRPLGCGAVVYVVANHGVRLRRSRPSTENQGACRARQR